MKATRFSGPTLYSDQYPPLEGFPTAFNPDYFQFMDDFEGKIVDTTNYWTFDSISNGTLAIYDTAPHIAAPYDNVAHGVCEIRSEVVDPLTSNSGGTMYSYINFQPFIRGQTFLYETRLGVSNPKNCDFFTGVVQSQAVFNPFDPAANSARSGFRLVASDGTGKIECVSAHVSSEEKVTDLDMPRGIPVYQSSTAGENGNEGPIDKFGFVVLGVQISHLAPRDFAQDYQVFIRYFINRKLVHTAIANTANPVFGNNNYSIVTSYKKVSNRTGLTLQTDLPNNNADVFAYINVPGTEDNNGSGLPQGTVLKIGSEFLRVLSNSPANRLGSNQYVLLQREQLGSTAAAHSVDASITEDTGSCLIDYSSMIVNRYPVYPDDPHINSRYLIDGKKSR